MRTAQPLSVDEALAAAHDHVASSPETALALARKVMAAAPSVAEAWRIAALAHRRLEQEAEAEAAELHAIRLSVHDPDLQQAAQALVANELHVAEPILRGRLRDVPTDVAAIRMLAELAARIGRYRDAEKLLRRALELAPAFHAARSNLATVLHRQNRTAEALAELDRLIAADPANPAHNSLKAAALGRVGDYDEAIALYEEVLEQLSGHPRIWMSYGHALKTIGRQQDAIAAYRRAITLSPVLGEGWWSLANLKTVRLDDADIATMEQALAEAAPNGDDRLHLHFALGKAHEDARRADRAFDHYARGNALRRGQIGYDPAETSAQVDLHIASLTPALLGTGRGCPAPDPIFILGMPRAGSTLVEQILSCHSMVEGTMELPDMPMLAAKAGRTAGGYPEQLDRLDADQLRGLGEEYLERTRIQRREGKPFFIDKLPNNWLHAGLIHRILPNARIIDARRHPLDCCFSNYKQHFARGQAFSYALDDMGRYYADYVRLMAHVDRVLPGRMCRVIHERLVDDPDREIRALLAALGLPFEEACLQFHESRRAVRTASSEQVRRPINRDGIGQWQPFADRLDPLREALGPVLDRYPDVPEAL